MTSRSPLEPDRLSRKVSADFASMALADITEGKSGLEDRCDFLLTKLDAFIQLMKSVGESEEFLLMNLPKVTAAEESLKEVYAQIDQLDSLVSDVKNSVDRMEQKVEEAENIFTTSYQKKIFKVLQNALGSSSSNTEQYRRQVRYTPVEIFRTEDYFPVQQDESEQSPSN